ncbi:exocyst complex component EXO70A1 [Physcomitrium patens]|uniref:Exocyst subunit Exo70 family protein n=1 Tax=Physcomitrium patens TaxID=3218 RepID=A0A2K1JMA5_PHYPA|nr:exocyst complex component EXO70A1-like [Physcomitrium patens]PNR42681.1 hypothetical protein PHYPA_017511 [Physcomitrium patens]|eukprot:XP_024392650.1 exocyst complex component EXO70A1-like [Physcomitrella patens]
MAVLDGEARVLLTAQHIIKALGTSDAMTDDMISVLSKFDHRFRDMNDRNLDRRLDASTSQKSPKGEDSDEDSYDVPQGSRGGSRARRVINSALDSARTVIVHWDMGHGGHEVGQRWIFENNAEETQVYLDAVDKVLMELENMKIHNRDPKLLEEAQNLLQLAMERLEEELRHVLEMYTGFVDPDVLLDSFSAASFRSPFDEEEEEEEEDDEEPNIATPRVGQFERSQSRAVALMPDQAAEYVIAIVTRLIAGGFKKECVQVYISSRKVVLENNLLALGVERVSIDEVQKMPWELLEEKIKSWNQAMKVGVTVLFASEKQLCDQVFAPPLNDICFNDFAKSAMMHLLSFGGAIAISRRAPEKLFKLLNMYETLRDLIPELEVIFSGTSGSSVRSEANGILSRLGEAIRGTISEFENAILRDSSKVPVMGGSVHPLTRYVMNYIKLACDYSDTLKQVYGERDNSEGPGRATQSPDEGDDRYTREESSPLASQVCRLAEALQNNLEGKSKLYKDPALTHVFLMNNFHYVVQKVKGSDVRVLIGDIWVRKQVSMVRQCAASYQRAAWGKVLACLRGEGLQGSKGLSSTSVSRQTLKDRFKNFNTIFDEVHRTQSQWVVVDPDLRDELRIFIANKILPAYRAFLGRYGHHIETGRHPDKYIKYTVEDLETAIGDFFTGHSGSLGSTSRRRSFSLHSGQ